MVDLSKYKKSNYNSGRSLAILFLWYLINVLIFRNPLIHFPRIKIFLLQLFGARTGTGIVIKPVVNIKYPWRLSIGNNTWIGEGVWVDSLAEVMIGSNCCISQGAYLCTGSHDYTKETFDLIVKPIVIEDGVWIGAKAIICLGVTLKTHSVITAGSVVTKDTEPYTVYRGNPAEPIRKRIIE